jgi:hypothetical protein
MVLESEEKIKELDEYIEILKQDLFFSMAEGKLKPENTNTHKIITIKQELDKAAQEKMTLSRIHYGNININNDIAPTAVSA